MDTTLPDLADDTSWLDSPEYDLPELPALSAEDEAMIEIVDEQVKVIMQVTAELEKERRSQRAAQRKKEAPARSPSEKISIRVPKHLMENPPRQNSCRPDKILNSGAMMRERRGAIRTGIQG